MLKFAWLELTGKCNLACTHCYAESGPHVPLHTGMRHEDWLKVILDCKAAGVRAIQFIGGEPLLYRRLKELVDYAREIGIDSIEIFTNGMALSLEKAEMFAKVGVKIATSFYANDPVIHDNITKIRGSFAKTLGGIQNAIAADASIRVEIIDVMKNEAVVADAEKLVRSLGVDKISINRVQSVGRGSSSIEPRYSVGDLCGNCGNGRVCITSDGSVYPCIMARNIPLGNIIYQSLGSICDSAELSNFRDVIISEDRLATDPHKLHRYANSCGPDHDCGPDRGCGPEGACGPDHSCGPDHPCGPDHTCGPDHSCGPDHPCGPDHGCGPNDRHCGPDEHKN